MPRSPSRDRSDRFTGNRGYFHRPSGLARWKLGLSLLAVAAVGGWVVCEVAFPEVVATAHTHGPLSSAHARWDDSCATCHAGFSPADVRLGSLLQPRDRWHALTCGKCHAVGEHHPTTTAADAAFHADCANCHHEHGGRSNSLTRLSDEHCVRCHADLAPHHVTGTPAVNPRVRGFAADHPEFRVLTKFPEGKPFDRGVKFSHALHMTPGLVYAEGAKGTMTPARVAELSGPAAAERYRKAGKGDDAPITLDCTSCHQAGQFGERAAHYQPVVFEAHCQSCHPLRAPAGVSGGAVIPPVEVPHRKQPSELREMLAGEYSRRLLDPKNPATSARPGPGGRFEPVKSPALVTYQQEVDRLTAKAIHALLQTAPPGPDGRTAVPGGSSCGKCHDPTGGEGKPEVARITLPARPPVFLASAKFSHAPHRGVQCASCHPGTGAAPFAESAGEREPVRITGIESCKQCHAPKREVMAESGRVTVGGIRHACTDCHKYHNGEHGRGRAPPAVPAERFFADRP